MRSIDADNLIAIYGNWYTEEGTDEGFIGTIKDIVDQMPTITLEQCWVPCKERQPDESDWYIVTLNDGILTIRWYSSYGPGWECIKDNNVIAWLPNPEPYRED